jgi:hypothetical protein
VLTYRVEYVPPGQRPVAASYVCVEPLEPGQWIEAAGVYLIVERVLRGKRGDANDGVALCKLALG